MSIINNLILDTTATVGDKLLLLSIRPYASYKEGVKGEQEGLTFNCLSEKLCYEKIDIKVSGIVQPPFDFDGTPIPVEFENLQGKLWQDWKNKGEVKISLIATNIRPIENENKRIRLGGDNE